MLPLTLRNGSVRLGEIVCERVSAIDEAEHPTREDEVEERVGEGKIVAPSDADITLDSYAFHSSRDRIARLLADLRAEDPHVTRIKKRHVATVAAPEVEDGLAAVGLDVAKCVGQRRVGAEERTDRELVGVSPFVLALLI